MNNTANGCLEAIVAFLVVIATALVLGLILALPLMWLWNWLMPSLFHLGTITWLEAWGLFVLSNLLFKGNHTNYNKSS